MDDGGGRPIQNLTFRDDPVLPDVLVEDTPPPECEFVKVEPGPPTTLRVRLRDGGSGLAEIRVIQSRNVTIDVPPSRSVSSSPRPRTSAWSSTT